MIRGFNNAVRVAPEVIAGESISVTSFGAKHDLQTATVAATAGSDLIDLVFGAGVGTISSDGATVTGTGTAFASLQQLSVGGLIRVGADVRRILAIDSDTVCRVDTEFPSALSGASYEATPASFDAEDVGKICWLRGPGAPSDRDYYMTGTAAVAASTDTMTPIAASVLDCQGATGITFCMSAHGAALDWEVWGSNSSSFGTETRVNGPSTQANQATGALWTTSSPTFRYYRIKIKSTASGVPATAYTSQWASGRLMGSTITEVLSDTQCRLANPATVSRAICEMGWGTDDTTAWENALREVGRFVRGGDRGSRLRVPPRPALITRKLISPRSIVLEGHSASGSRLVACPARFPESNPVLQLGELLATQQAGSYFTRLHDIGIDCSGVPGSIGILSETLQENSGLCEVLVTGTMACGIRLKTYANQHLGTRNLWSYPHPASLANDAYIGLDFDGPISTNMVESQNTIYGNPPYVIGYGTAIRLNAANVFIRSVHIESARIGIHFNTDSIGTVGVVTGHATVEHLVRVTTNNSVELGSLIANQSKYTLTDDNSAKSYQGDDAHEYSVTGYKGLTLPWRIRGNINSERNIAEWVPGTWAGGESQTAINRYGLLQVDSGSPSSPSTIVIGGVNHGGVAQGGVIGVGSFPVDFPNFRPTHRHCIVTANSSTDTLLSSTDLPSGWATDTVVYIWYKSGGSLPGGLAEGGTPYYLKNISGRSFQLAATAGGAAIDITSNGTGEIWVYEHGRGGWLWLSPNRMQFRSGMAGNREGTAPGQLVGEFDATNGAFIPKLYFATTADTARGPMKIGNEFGAHRARLTHGQAGQVKLAIEASADSGSSWQDVIYFDLSALTTVMQYAAVANLVANRPVVAGGGSVLQSGSISLTNPNHVSGSSSGSVALGGGSGELTFQGLATFAASLIPTLQANFDGRYVKITDLTTVLAGYVTTGVFSSTLSGYSTVGHGHSEYALVDHTHS